MGELGNGELMMTQKANPIEDKCDKCKGSGTSSTGEKCDHCRGKGFYSQ